MNDELPDDVSLWPRDPAKLLGVSGDADLMALKRAYSRLIKRFKPEQFPEQFRRVREAYEFLLDRQRFAGLFLPFVVPQDEPSANTTPDRPVPKRKHSHDPAELAWEQACAGEEEQAYHALVNLEESGSGSDETAVRLYWLLRLNQDLDRHRSPVEWLAVALRRSNDDRIRELLRRELWYNPCAATHTRVGQLLAADLPSDSLAELVEWRWRAANLAGNPWVIVEDAALLRPRLQPLGVPWLRLLFVAADVLVWADPPESDDYRWCLDEIAGLDHLTREMDFLFDRLDHLRELSRQWRWLAATVSTLPAAIDVSPAHWTRQILALIPKIWNLSGEMILPELMAFAASVADDPRRWLEFLDRIGQYAPAVVHWLMIGVRMLPEREAEPEEIDDAAIPSALTKAGFWHDYARRRDDFLEFCLTSFLAPEAVAEHIAAHWIQRIGDIPLADLVASDLTLRLVFEAVRRFRG